MVFLFDALTSCRFSLTNAYWVLVYGSSARACRRGSGMCITNFDLKFIYYSRRYKYFKFSITTKLHKLHLPFGFNWEFKTVIILSNFQIFVQFLFSTSKKILFIIIMYGVRLLFRWNLVNIMIKYLKSFAVITFWLLTLNLSWQQHDSLAYKKTLTACKSSCVKLRYIITWNFKTVSYKRISTVCCFQD